jgi:chemotaxis protein CheD
MRRTGSSLQRLYLKPGELIVTREPVLVATVLGSCISVTMFDRQTGAAGICHATLPDGGGSDNFKYVDAAVRYMLKYFQKCNIASLEIQVKLFGGADMFSTGQAGTRNITVGWQNISAATRCLAGCGLVPVAADVGGRKGRKLLFTTDTGAVYVKKMTGQAMGSKAPFFSE